MKLDPTFISTAFTFWTAIHANLASAGGGGGGGGGNGGGDGGGTRGGSSGGGGGDGDEAVTYYNTEFDHFSKVQFLDPQVAATNLPFHNYPLTELLGQLIKMDSRAASPMMASDLPGVDAGALIAQIGGMPAFPGDELFWEELSDVLDVQLARRAGANPPFRLPDVWSGFRIGDVAEAVHDEYPILAAGTCRSLLFRCT